MHSDTQGGQNPARSVAICGVMALCLSCRFARARGPRMLVGMHVASKVAPCSYLYASHFIVRMKFDAFGQNGSCDGLGECCTPPVAAGLARAEAARDRDVAILARSVQ